MADSDVNLERFAHDVCVKVLENFAVFKTPDDLRKENKYVCHDFLPRISRSVVSFALCVRMGLQMGLRDLKTTPTDEEIFSRFEGQLTESLRSYGEFWTENMCASLGVCTEYIQFMSSKGIHVSLNKLVIKWKKYFDEHMKKTFEEKGGFTKLYDYLEKSQTDELDKFHEAFISQYCLPYGQAEYTGVSVEECVKKYGLKINLKKTALRYLLIDSDRASTVQKAGPSILFSFVDEEDQEALANFNDDDNFPPEKDTSSAAQSPSPPKTESSGKLVTRSRDSRFSSSSPESKPDSSNLQQVKSGRGGSRMLVQDPKDKMPPNDPELCCE